MFRTFRILQKNNQEFGKNHKQKNSLFNIFKIKINSKRNVFLPVTTDNRCQKKMQLGYIKELKSLFIITVARSFTFPCLSYDTWALPILDFVNVGLWPTVHKSGTLV